MKVVNGRFIPDIAGELKSQECLDQVVSLLEECANAFSATVDGDTLALTALSCTGTGTFTGDNTDGILISGNNTDGIHLSGTNTANAIHISGDQACAMLVDVDAALATGISFAVDTGITMTTGIAITCTGTGTVTTAISLTYTNSATECIAITLATGKTITTGMSMSGAGTYTTGILLDATAITTGISISAGSLTDGIKISGTTPVDGIEISSACSANGINLSGANLVGMTVTGSTTGITLTNCTTAINVSTAAIGASGRIAKFFGGCAAGNLGDGVGAVECDLTITGNVAGMVSPLSSWVNMISVTTGANYVAAQTNGLYSEVGGVLTNGVFIFGMRMQCLCQTNGGAVGATFYPFSIVNNTNVTTALILCNDATSDLGETASACDAETMIPLFQDNEGIRYVKVYTHS